MENPKVRQLEAFPAQISGKEVIGIKDPIGICPEILFIPHEAFFLITLMDGTNSLRDLQAAYMRKYGGLLFSEKLKELIEQLDSYYLLETRRFWDHLRSLRDEFKEARIRKAAFAGKGYEAEPERLKAQLQGYFTDPEGPGLDKEAGEKRALQGIVAPHIDFARGGACYAHAYNSLKTPNGADLYIILGTCHTPMENPFAFTLKSFETPLGVVEVERDLVGAIAQRLPFDPFLDEFSHRNEHTIEFQVIFLQHLLGETEFKIFPILCGSFHEIIHKGISPLDDPRYRDAISVLKETISPRPRTCVIASADLAHVGAQFGGTEMVTPGVSAEVKANDLEMLHYVEQLNEQEFFRFILREKDRRNICGLPPIYTLLQLVQAQEGELVHYQQWCDHNGRGMVTFAGMVFT